MTEPRYLAGRSAAERQWIEDETNLANRGPADNARATQAFDDLVPQDELDRSAEMLGVVLIGLVLAVIVGGGLLLWGLLT
jgi:hypothetical protein